MVPVLLILVYIFGIGMHEYLYRLSVFHWITDKIRYIQHFCISGIMTYGNTSQDKLAPHKT